MPLEYGYYNRKGYSDWFINNILVWGYDYYYDLSVLDKINFISKVNPNRLFLGVKAKFDDEIYKKEEKVADKLEKLIATDGEKWRGYNYKSSNLDGDINADEFNNVKNIGSYNYGSEPSQHFLEIFNKIKKLVNNKNGKLYLVPPITFRNAKFDLTNFEHLNKYKSYLEKLSNDYDINIKCNPILFNIDEKYAFNTHYHPNKYGALIRSENLAHCINRLTNNDNNNNISDTEAMKVLELLEKRYANYVKLKPIPNFDKRFKDLTKIKIALDIFYKENKFYPKSKGYDGIYTKWGDSKEYWIVGLVPKYISSLPKDPRNTDDPSKQYLYKSNGKDYKLISHSAEDCQTVKISNPKMIDPKRDCWAYGFWTEGAKNW